MFVDNPQTALQKLYKNNFFFNVEEIIRNHKTAELNWIKKMIFYGDKYFSIIFSDKKKCNLIEQNGQNKPKSLST